MRKESQHTFQSGPRNTGGSAGSIMPTSAGTKVRKNLSRSNSELDFGPRRRKPCSAVRTAECFCTANDSLMGTSAAPSLPPGLLSCLSMLELSKLDSTSDAGAGAHSSCSALHRRIPSRTGSMLRTGSAGTMTDILARIRVPSQRAAMAEMAAAADRIEAQQLTRGASTLWCQAPTRQRPVSGHRRTSSAGSLSNVTASTFELDPAQLDAVLLSDAAYEPMRTSPFTDGAGHTVQSPAPATCPVSSRHATGHRGDASVITSSAASSTQPSSMPCFGFFSSDPVSARAETGASGCSFGAPTPTWQAASSARADTQLHDSRAVDITAPLHPLSRAAASPAAPEAHLAASRPHLVPTAFQWIPGAGMRPGVAAEVCLCGTFNNWEERLPMHRKAGHRGEEWWVVLNLPPGEYAYKFVVRRVDGNVEWQHAPDQPSLVDAHGHSNNWICVLNQLAYEAEEPAQLAHHAAEDEDGYTQDVAAEFYEMLFATEPPSIPACLALEPPPYGDMLHGLDAPPDSPLVTCNPADSVACASRAADVSRPLVHSSLHHLMVATQAAEGGPNAPDALYPTGVEGSSPAAHVEGSRATPDMATPMPPPVISQMTLRCRDKFVTIEFVRAAAPTRYM